MEQKKSNVLSILSLIFGIVGLVLSCIFLGVLPAIAGLVLGILALTQKQSKGMAIIGIVCGAIGLLVTMALLASFSDTSGEEENKDSYIESVDNSSVDNSSETDESSVMEEDVVKTFPNIEEEVIYDSKDVVITVKGMEQEGKNYNVKLLIENNSALNLRFYAHAYGVNGIMSENNIYDMKSDVAAGKKANVFLELESVFLNKYGIDEIRYISLLLWVYDNDKSYKEFDTDQLLIKTSLFNDQSDAPSGTVIYDGQDVVVEFVEREKNTFTFMIANNTDSYFNFDFAEFSVNDYTMTDMDYSLYNNIILRNNVVFCSVTISDEFIKNNSIDEIEKVEWNLNCRPYGSYFDEYKVGTIVFEVE